MKNILLIIIISIAGFSSSVKAQDYNKEKRTEKIQALKIAFITQKLDLTTDEAQRFWPVFNRYETELKQSMVNKKMGGGDALEDEEQILNIKRKYQSEFTRVIGQPKTNSLFNAEKEFRGALMRRLKDNPENKRNNSFPNR